MNTRLICFCQQRFAPAGLLLVLAMLGGCGSTFSGLDGSSSFSCAAPPGVTCTSTSGIYANAAANNLPGSRRLGEETRNAEDPSHKTEKSEGVTAGRRPLVAYDTPINTLAAPERGTALSPRAFNAPNSGTPLRTPERIMRVWFAPTTDEEDAIHDQRFVYLAVAPGSWTLEATRATVRAQFQPLHALSTKNPANRQANNGSNGSAQPRTPAQVSAAQPNRDPLFHEGNVITSPLPNTPVFPTTSVAPSWDIQ